MSATEDHLPKTTAAQLEELIAAGPDAVTTATSVHVLVLAARKYVKQVAQQRARAVARAAEAEAREAQRVVRPKRTPSEVDAALLKEAMQEAAMKAILAARERWIELADQEFTLPDGQVVTWAEATIDDHLARAGAQRTLAAGIERDVALHEKAAADLRTFGVYRLGDLASADPKAVES